MKDCLNLYRIKREGITGVSRLPTPEWVKIWKCKLKWIRLNNLSTLSKHFFFLNLNFSLVAGDVEGQYDVLFNRVNTINKKSGPFDMLLCVGDFFNVSTESQLQSYLTKEKKGKPNFYSFYYLWKNYFSPCSSNINIHIRPLTSWVKSVHSWPERLWALYKSNISR